MVGIQCAACHGDRRWCICWRECGGAQFGQVTFPPKGCICPPTSEKTCEALDCPRKGSFATAAGTIARQPKAGAE